MSEEHLESKCGFGMYHLPPGNFHNAPAEVNQMKQTKRQQKHCWNDYRNANSQSCVLILSNIASSLGDIPQLNRVVSLDIELWNSFSSAWSHFYTSHKITDNTNKITKKTDCTLCLVKMILCDIWKAFVKTTQYFPAKLRVRFIISQVTWMTGQSFDSTPGVIYRSGPTTDTGPGFGVRSLALSAFNLICHKGWVISQAAASLSGSQCILFLLKLKSSQAVLSCWGPWCHCAVNLELSASGYCLDGWRFDCVLVLL